MNFTVQVELGNDAMLKATDVARALRELSNRLSEATSPQGEGVVRDDNGNRVGRWAFVANDEEPAGPALVAEARAQLGDMNENVVDVDDDACVVRTQDGGAWVAAWVYVAPEADDDPTGWIALVDKGPT